jgi:xylan 1,4-beta-xylosidase
VVRKAALFARVFALALGVEAVGRAEPSIVTIDVDATAPGAPLERVWAYYGYDEPNHTTAPESVDLLRTLAEVHTAPVHVRAHFLFNTGDGTPSFKWGSTNIYGEDGNEEPVYDYALIDQIMDATVAAGAFPLVEIGFMPKALSIRPDPYENSDPYVLDGGCFYPPKDYEKWGALVRAYAEHVKERYPNAEAAWQWELWNEPDLPYWRGTFAEFARLYDYTEAALHSVFPNASLGGPAVAGAGGIFFRDFLEHCETGTNAVSGETGTRLDMVSFHAKGGVTDSNGFLQMNLGAHLRQHRTGFEVVSSSSFAETPIVISESDPEACAACPASDRPENAYRYSPAYGAYELVVMKRSLELAAAEGVNLRGVLTWAFTFPGTSYFSGYRELATNGIHLPVLNAFKLLGSLHGERVPVVSSGAIPLEELLASGVRDRPDVDALAAVDGERVQVLVWNYHDDLVAADPAPVTLNVAVPRAFGANALVTHTRVDDTRGNAHAVWVSQGSPQEPSGEELAALKDAMEPVVLERERETPVSDGVVTLSFELPRFGMSLFLLTRSNDGGGGGGGGGGGDGGNDKVAPPSDPGCSCRLGPAERDSRGAYWVLSFALAITRRRRPRAA